MKTISKNIIDKFNENYKKAITLKYVKKPISWSLYRTWRWFDKNEQPIGRDGDE